MSTTTEEAKKVEAKLTPKKVAKLFRKSGNGKAGKDDGKS